MNLSVAYSKQAEQQLLIKNGHLVSAVTVDHRNNVYVSIGDQIHIYSLRRLSKSKDYLMDIIEVKKLMPKQLQADTLTDKFNNSPVAECIEFAIQNNENKFIEPLHLMNRYKYLNNANPKILQLTLSHQFLDYPRMCVLLNDGTMLVLANAGHGYVTEYNQQNIRIARFLKTDSIVLVDNKYVSVLGRGYSKDVDFQIEQGIVNIDICKLHQYTIYVLFYVEYIQILKIDNKKRSLIRKLRISHKQFCYYSSINSSNILYFASALNCYSADLTQDEIKIEHIKDLRNERVLLMDKNMIVTSANFREKSNTKCIAKTTNNFYVSINIDNGTSFKEADLIISNPDCYQIVKNSIMYLQDSRERDLPVNFHDMRILSKKPILSEILEILLMLYDKNFVDSLKNVKEKKINTIIMNRTHQLLEDLKLANIQMLIEKLLIILLNLSDVTNKSLLDQLVLNTVRNYLQNKHHKNFNIETATLKKRCIHSYETLGEGDIFRCFQCKYYSKSNHELICYLCWGEFRKL